MQSKKVKAFLKDIIAVYKKHNMAISNEDSYSTFEIEPLDKFYVEWLQEANDNTEKGKK
jgi:hypothetical protein